ncbi:hypothetical protein GCM10027217_16520 [Pseudomaricurvus hydrocarbonicus]
MKKATFYRGEVDRFETIGQPADFILRLQAELVKLVVQARLVAMAKQHQWGEGEQGEEGAILGVPACKYG